MPLNRMQIRTIAAVLAGSRFVALRAGWGSGKSYALGAIALRRGETSGADVMWTTDTHGRLEKVVLPVCEAMLAPAGWTYKASANYWQKGRRRIWLSTYFRPSTRTEASNNAEGSNILTLLIDEAQAFRDDEVIRKMTGRTRVRATEPPLRVVAGLPVYGAWWEDVARRSASGVVIHGTSYDNRANLAPEWFADALETLGPREFRAMLLNEPRPPEGQIYDSWSPDVYPDGNVVRGWSWHPAMRTVLAVDFGWIKPSVLVLAHDTSLGAWVICGEVNPAATGTMTPELARQVLRIAWPRRYAAQRPAGVPMLFDEVVADPAGKAHNVHTGLTDLQILGEVPPGCGTPRFAHGLGVTPVVETDPVRRDVEAGITRTHRAIERRQVLVTSEVWEAGLRAGEGRRSFARAIAGYIRDGRGEPVRNRGHDDVMDALRYFVRLKLWWDGHPTDGRVYSQSLATVNSPIATYMDDR